MKRWLFFIYGVGCYLLFLATYAYMAGFVGGAFVPRTIDTPSALPLVAAVGVNLFLLGLFAVQHSVMARPAFKQLWTHIVPKPIERSTYVLASCLVTIILMWQWQGIDAVGWHVQIPQLRSLMWALFVAGWLAVPTVTLLLNHFDLFGLRQVWLHLRGQEYTSLEFRVPLAYKHVRHPLYLGWALAFWAIPTMTVGHLMFAGVLTLYMAGAAVVEERDLIVHFGEQYREYRRRVPMFVPRFGKITEPEPVSEVPVSEIARPEIIEV